ncbi:MAG: hypothetical protein HY020_01100 [Burkholderiales bacterium]|nr:hypothetical protein [Burkholderiales bacterium]
MVASVNNSLLNFLTAQGQDAVQASTLANGKATTPGSATTKANTTAVSKAALDRASGTAKSLAAGHSLEAGENKLATDLRAELAEAGVKLSGAIEFSVKSDGTVETKGSDADKKAVKAFLSADASQSSFANRIATQAKEAMKLSSTFQQAPPSRRRPRWPAGRATSCRSTAATCSRARPRRWCSRCRRRPVR